MPRLQTCRQYFFDVYSRRLLGLHAEKKRCEDAFLSRVEGDPRGLYNPPEPGTRRFKIQQQLLDTCVDEYNRVKAAMKRAFKDDTKSPASNKNKRVEVDSSLLAISTRLNGGLVHLQQAIDALSIELSAREREVRALEECINKAEAEAAVCLHAWIACPPSTHIIFGRLFIFLRVSVSRLLTPYSSSDKPVSNVSNGSSVVEGGQRTIGRKQTQAAAARNCRHSQCIGNAPQG